MSIFGRFNIGLQATFLNLEVLQLVQYFLIYYYILFGDHMKKVAEFVISGELCQ